MPKLWTAQIVAFTATTVVQIDKHYSRWTGKELDRHIRHVWKGNTRTIVKTSADMCGQEVKKNNKE